MLTTLQGEVERITYASEDHTFVIAKLRIKGRKDLITIVGNVLVPAPGEQITVTGEWTTHPFYGSQFKVHSYAVTAPATISGIEKYLGSGLIKGIGPQLAKRIVHHFGSRTFEIIEKSPALLTQVAGIGDGRAGLIQEAWTAQHEIREVMVFLQSHGVSSRYAAKIFKTYGKQSIAVVQENPYRLAMDIPGIGFLAADHIAEGLGFDKGSPLRAESGILYVLGMLAGEGNVYYPLEPLVDRCRQMLQIPEGTLIDALSALASRQKVIIEDISCSPLNKRPHRAVFLAAYYNSEATIAHRLATILAAPQSTAAEALSQAISQSRKHISIVLSPLQIQALNCAAHSKMTIITGGPGTGKTTLIAALLLIFSAAGSRILLAAPTGRAAKRMTEATGIDAKTIHRLLEYSLRDGGFQKNEHNPLCCDVLIVDEASMIDTLLMYHLVQAIPAEATIILVGDINQLPSVGPGTVLKDMIAAGIAPVVELREVFRQAQESRIVTNAHKVNSGQLPVMQKAGAQLSDFYFIEKENPDEALQLIIDLVTDHIPRRFGFDALRDIQVLTPMNKGITGVENLNHALQQSLNPQGEVIARRPYTFRINDRVMQIRNNYEKEVFNGDIGCIRGFDSDTQEITVAYDDCTVTYDTADMDELILAYAITIHKAQGSEYPAVVIPILSQHHLLLQRNLLYTAITRGRRLVVIVGSKQALAYGVQNDTPRRRYTGLARRLAATKECKQTDGGDSIDI